MKKIGVFLFFVIISFAFVCASIDVDDYFLKTTYIPFEKISGNISLNIENENFDSLITSNLDGEVSLSDFLDDNGADYECSPSDCSSDYEYSNAETSKIIDVNSGEDSFAGFVLRGNDAYVSGLSFDIESNFQRSVQVPLAIKFFENDVWEFSEFSDEYSSENYGCYNSLKGSAGALIRNSNYCESINISGSGSILAGAKVSGTDTERLEINVYDNLYGSIVGSCDFAPFSGEDSCEIEADTGSLFDGEYYVCVGKYDDETNYKIYSETYGTNCGFIYGSSVTNQTDYGIFVKEAKYEDASALEIEQDYLDELIDEMNYIIDSRYNGDCSSGCVLPMQIRGISQDLEISNIVLDYSNSNGDFVENKIYDLEEIPASVDFEGVLDLELLGFEVGSDDDEVLIYLGGEKIIDKEINVLDAAYIISVYPINPPAGVPVIFYANVENDYLVDKYLWDFGDGSSVKTSEEDNIIHSYNKTGNFTLKLTIDSGNLTSSKTFSINAVSPEEAVNNSIKSLRKAVDNVNQDILKFPSWYQSSLEKYSNITYYDSELERLEKKYEKASSESSFVEIAKELYSMDFPLSIYVSETSLMPLITDLNEINPLPVQMIAGGNEENLDMYKNSIIQWQIENIEAVVDNTKISVAKNSGKNSVLLNVYLVDVFSNSDLESYFVIDKDLSSLFFKENADARKQGDFSVIILDKYEEKSFGFYSVGKTDSVFFVSPKLSYLPVLEGEIGKCNFNDVCEKSRGEDYKNCRNDCKPVGLMVFWIIFVFVVGLGLYTLAQVWYKKKYESYLFKDKRELFNLVMFVANARARGLTDNKIVEQLHEKKWDTEKIVYALKKSRGERTGLYEIVPVEKVVSYFRNLRARKDVSQGLKREAPVPFSADSVNRVQRRV